MMHTFLTVLALLIGADSAPAADTWPAFRGGAGVTAAKDLPLTWTETENLAWKFDLPGYGQSSPVVWKDTVFLTAVDGPRREKGFVLACDARTGKRRWVYEFEPTQKAKWSNMISRAAPTPAVDAAAVYTFFEGGNLLALSHDGKPLWSRSLVKDFGEFQNNHHLGSSPAQTDDALFVLVDHRGPSYLLAVDKKTGKDRWKTERTSRGSWTSPVVASRDGKPEVIVSSNGSVAGYDARSGKLLWELDGLNGNAIPSASVSGNWVVVGAGQGRGIEVKPGAKTNFCLKLVEKEGKPGFEVCWEAKPGLADYATPLIHGGHVYFVNQSGVVFCCDLKTGKECYAERIEGPCWASPVGAGEHVYFFGKDGTATVLKAGPTFEKIASNRLWGPDKLPARPAEKPKDGEAKGPPGATGFEYLDPIVYGVAAVDGAFFVRTGTALYRVGKP